MVELEAALQAREEEHTAAIERLRATHTKVGSWLNARLLGAQRLAL